MKSLAHRISKIVMVSALLTIGTAFSQTTLVIAGEAGGAANDFLEDYVIPLFQEAHPEYTVVVEPGLSMEQLGKVRAGVPIDIVLLEGDDLVNLARDEGLLQEVDYSALTNADAYPDFAVRDDGYGIASTLNMPVIAYNPDVLESAPTSWLAPLTEEFAGRSVLVHISRGDGTQAQLMMAFELGGSETDVQGMLDYVAENKDNLLTMTDSSSTFSQLFERGEAVIGTINLKRVVEYEAQGISMAAAVPGGRTIANMNFLAIPATSQNVEGALLLMDFMLSKEIQVEQGVQVGNLSPRNDVPFPENVSALLDYPIEEIEFIDGIDWQYVADNKADWVDAWNRIFQ